MARPEATTRPIALPEPDAVLFVLLSDQPPDTEPPRALVEEVDETSLVATFYQRDPPPRGPVWIRYAGDQQGFFSVPAEIDECDSDGGRHRVTFRFTGDPSNAESRAAFRVLVSEGMLVANHDGERDCPVIDISFSGIAIHTVCQLAEGSELTISLVGEERKCTGLFIVRHTRKGRGRQWHCGLELAPDQDEVAKWMRATVMEIQRAQLQRLSFAHGVDAEASRAATTPPAEDPSRDAESPDPDRADPPSEPSPAADEADAAETASGTSDTDASPCGTERRRFGRARFASRATVQVLGDDHARPISVVTSDLSRGGIAFRSPEPIPPDASLLIRFDGLPDAPWILARVIHCTNEEGPSCVGTRFLLGELQRRSVPSLPALEQELAAATKAA